MGGVDDGNGGQAARNCCAAQYKKWIQPLFAQQMLLISHIQDGLSDAAGAEYLHGRFKDLALEYAVAFGG